MNGDIEAALSIRFKILAEWGDFKTAWTPDTAKGDSALQSDVTALLGKYPFLEQDPGYVTFLRCYGGAVLVRTDALVLSLYGFSHEVGMHIVEGPGDPMHAGCLVFCDMVVPLSVRERVDDTLKVPTVAVGFGIEGSRRRDPGIYRFIQSDNGSLFCSTFLAWLDRLIQTDGQVNS